jgi:ParB/RepB/Spo0J family partition protein
MSEQFAQIGLSLITPSLTNPRKYFNQERLQDLANSIKPSGVHTPILLRFLPGSRAPDTDRDVIYELVTGERRWRASIMAGLDTIPALIRPLTDDQVLEIQLVENLQRDDLTELEEAEGYDALMQHADINADQVAVKIGKSRSYVYSRLKLMDLCQQAREAFRAGDIDASKALLIARIPDEKLQIKALGEFAAIDHRGDARMSFRDAQDWIKQNVMLRLADARFKITDASLVKSAGACGDCPKRTGANPDLFSDADSPDICIDPACFHGKEAAHTAVIVEAARKKGMEVIEGKEALELKFSRHSPISGHVDLDAPSEWDDEESKQVSLRSVTTKDEFKGKIKLFVDPHTGETKHIVTREVAAESQQKREAKAERKEQAEYRAPAESEDQKRLRLSLEYEKAWRVPAAAAVVPRIQAGAVNQFEVPVLRFILAALALHEDTDYEICVQVLNLTDDDNRDVDMFVHDMVERIPELELGARICTLVALSQSKNLRTWADKGWQANKAYALESLAESCGIDLGRIKAQVQGQMLDVVKTPAARPAKSVAGKAKKSVAKLSAEDAMSGIAAAMQEEDDEVEA